MLYAIRFDTRYRKGRGQVWKGLVLVFLLLAACSDDEEPIPAPTDDTTAPGVVGDLTVTDYSSSNVVLRWSAPADDDTVGGAVEAYDIRYRPGSLDSGVWDSASEAEHEPEPSDPGEEEVFVVGNLDPGTEYAVGLRSIDDAGLISALSNVVRFETEQTPETDTIPPGPILDLAAIEVGVSSIRLQWTAVGDDGQEGIAGLYDLRYRPGQIDGASWGSAIQVSGEPSPGTPGSVES